MAVRTHDKRREAVQRMPGSMRMHLSQAVLAWLQEAFKYTCRTGVSLSTSMFVPKPEP